MEISMIHSLTPAVPVVDNMTITSPNDYITFTAADSSFSLQRLVSARESSLQIDLEDDAVLLQVIADFVEERNGPGANDLRRIAKVLDSIRQ